MPTMQELLQMMKDKSVNPAIIEPKPELRAQTRHETSTPATVNTDIDNSYPIQGTVDQVPLDNKNDLVDFKVNNSTTTEDELEQLTGISNSSSRAPIVLNSKQLLANQMVQDGKSLCLIGAAGTGKTTTMKKTTMDLMSSGRIQPIGGGTKWLKSGSPGCVILSYTRKAVNNIRRSVTEELKAHTLTIHKLLEFAPVKYEIPDLENGGFKMTMKFEPQRNRDNPLPKELSVVIWEESSMTATDLYNMFKEAMQHEYQEVFLGDIQQLPPIFGLAVLGFKMLELPVVELTEVYRQALNSPIISLAWKILDGDPYQFSSRVERYIDQDTKQSRLRCPALDALTKSDPEYGSTTFQIWQKTVDETKATAATLMLFKKWYNEGYYDPKEDIILCPFNKSFGTLEINKHISQYFSILTQEPTHEIIAGFNKLYMAVGDRVLYDKEDAFIISIEPNPVYTGKSNYAIPSVYLDRWGIQQTGQTEQEILQAHAAMDKMGDEQVEYYLEGNASFDEIDERVNAASHTVTIKISHSDEVISLGKAQELNNLLGGYCITIHKAQGSEWDKVFLWLHHSHVKMCSRELLYTAVTRARTHLHIMCENTTFEKGIKSQRIKGNTLKEKALVFEGKLKEGGTNVEPLKSMDLDLDKLKEIQQSIKDINQTTITSTNSDETTKQPLVQSPESESTSKGLVQPVNQNQNVSMKELLAKLKRQASQNMVSKQISNDSI